MFVDSNRYCGSCFIAPEVNKKFKKCGGCKKTRYCSLECQQNHWPWHKIGCSASLKGHVTPVSIDINSLNSEGMSRLHVAAFHNDRTICQKLLDRGATPDFISSDGHSPLYYAVQNGHKEIVQLFMEYKHQTPMRFPGLKVVENAFELKRQDIVLLLIPNDNYFFPHLMMMAAKYGACQVFDFLLDRLEGDAELLNEKNRLMIATFKRAIMNKQYKFLEHLLKRGIVPFAQVYDIALAPKCGTLLKLLATHGLPLRHCLKTDEPEKLKVYLEKGADPNKTDEFGFTPLYWAIARGNIKMNSLLLSHGASMTNLCKNGLSACDLAINLSQTDILKLLIKHNNDREEGEECLRALCAARDEGAVALANFLYEHLWSHTKTFNETMVFIESIMGKKITERREKEAILRIVLSKQV